MQNNVQSYMYLTGCDAEQDVNTATVLNLTVPTFSTVTRASLFHHESSNGRKYAYKEEHPPIHPHLGDDFARFALLLPPFTLTVLKSL